MHAHAHAHTHTRTQHMHAHMHAHMHMHMHMQPCLLPTLRSLLTLLPKISNRVNEKLNIAFDTDVRINTAREEYRPSARRGALLYFLIVDMAAINNMYMVSLQQFLELHGERCLSNADRDCPRTFACHAAVGASLAGA